MRTTSFSVLVTILVVLAGCGPDPAEAVASAEAAQGDALGQYAKDIVETIDIAANPDLVQRFCKNAFGTSCPADITISADSDVVRPPIPK